MSIHFMLFRTKLLGLAFPLSVVLMLSACAGTSKPAAISQAGSTTSTIYRPADIKASGSDVYDTTTTLATTTLPVIASHPATADDMPIVVSLNEVKRTGSLVAITWTVSAPPTNTGVATLSFAFAPVTNGEATFDGVSLVDQTNQRNYPTAHDASNNCLCTSASSYFAPKLTPGSSTVFSNETGAPPADVHTVDIAINGAGIFAGVNLA